jgi:hypothetical protein
MLNDKTKGFLSYRDRKFYFLETGKIVYLGNPVPRLRQTLVIKGLLKTNDIVDGTVAVMEWKEAKLKNIESCPIFLNEHIKRLHSSSPEVEVPNVWDNDD